MSSERHIFGDHYTDGKPCVTVKVAIVNEENGRQITIQKTVKIDTGFDGGIHVAEHHKADVTMIGVNPVVGTVTLAGETPSTAYHCLAYLQQIGNFQLPMPGIEMVLVLHGTAQRGLLGLDILKHWIVKFDGPNEFFKITSSSAQPPR